MTVPCWWFNLSDRRNGNLLRSGHARVELILAFRELVHIRADPPIIWDVERHARGCLKLHGELSVALPVNCANSLLEFLGV